MRYLKVVLVFVFLLLSHITTFAQQLTDKAEVSLFTCGSGDELYSVFGHTAIRVNDPEQNIDTVYNFGTFDFDTPNFYLKFVKGDLQYFVSVASYRDFIYEYEYFGRAVYEQVLNLTQKQKQEIFDELNNILLSDKRFYTYKFIDRNCTTMVADIINKHEKISLENSDKGKTYREIIYSYLNDNHFYENLGINLLFGSKTDELSKKLFLPKELMEGVNHTTTEKGALAKKTLTIIKQEKNEKPFDFWNSYYSYALIMIIILVLSYKKLVYRSFLALTGLLGLLFAFIGFYSQHMELLANYNVLLCNPLFLVLLYFIFTDNQLWVKRLSYLCLSILAVYVALILTKPHFILMLPIIVIVVVIFVRLIRRTTLKRIV